MSWQEWFQKPAKATGDPEAIERVAQLAARLQELAEADVDFKVFGADDHRYRLNARLDEQEVARFELEYDVQLPSEYREFLICIGNAGAGPYYGLLPLDKAVSTHGERSRAFLSAPFPLTKAFDPYCESSDEEGEEAYDIHVRGSIAICHEGCGYYDRLVISGPQKGQMWFDGRVSDQGLAPLNLTFADWYGLWLSESMADLWRLY